MPNARPVAPPEWVTLTSLQVRVFGPAEDDGASEPKARATTTATESADRLEAWFMAANLGLRALAREKNL